MKGQVVPLGQVKQACFEKHENTQVASYKMVHKKRHLFLAQFSIAFHMVWSILFGVLALKTLEDRL